MENRSMPHIKFDAVVRLLMQNTLSGALPLYIVTEYQKSGGSWVGQMVSEYLDLPFPRNRVPAIRSSVLHGHIMPTPFLKNVLCVYRDGRDTVVSSYFHMLFESDKNSPHLVKRCRDDLKFDDYDDVKENMPRFIEYLFTEHHVKTLFRRNQFTWAEFVDAWYDKKVASVKYEKLLSEPLAEMSQALKIMTNLDIDNERLQVIINKYSFENQTKRKPGQEDKKSFLRKGQAGDWKEKFTREAAETFNYYAGNQLKLLSYEDDDSWIETLG
jgi:Sulfotransferase domain